MGRLLGAAVLALGASMPGVSRPWAGEAVDAERAQYDLARSLCDRAEDARFADLALEELERYERQFPEGRFLDDVYFRMARVEEEQGRRRRAAARLLGVILLEPGSLRDSQAREQLERLLASDRGLRGLKERYGKALESYAGAGGNRGDRRLAYARALLLVDDPELTDLVAQVMLVGVAQSDTPVGDRQELSMALGDLFRRRGQDRRAVVAYERVAHLEPRSPVTPRALLAEAGLLAGSLNAPRDALRVYERIAREMADAPEAASAWYRMGEVERHAFRRYDKALRDYDEVLERYPDHPDAFDALLSKAATYDEGLRDLRQAERVLVEGLDRYGRHARAPEALYRAAELAEQARGGGSRPAELYERVARDYPGYARSPEALYRAAELRREAGERERALALYEDLLRRYPGSPLARKARGRAGKLRGE